MQSFLEFLTKALLYVSIIILVTTILTFVMLLLVEKRRIKPNAPSPAILLWPMIGGTTVLIITSVLIATGVLPHISVALPDIDVSPYIGN